MSTSHENETASQPLRQNVGLQRSINRRSRLLNVDYSTFYKNLTPNIILQALSQRPDDYIPTHPSYDSLVKSIELAPVSEIEFGLTVAKCYKHVLEWCKEIESWPWDGTFDPRHTKDAGSESFNESQLKNAGDASENESSEGQNTFSPSISMTHPWGSRLEEIDRDLQNLNMEDHKKYILKAYTSPEDPVFTSEPYSQSNYKHLDGLTALVTYIELQILPVYLKLSQMINVWRTRRRVLAYIAPFQEETSQAKASLGDAWKLMERYSCSNLEPGFALLNKEVFSLEMLEERSKKLETQISSLGGTLDVMLDLLEGYEDTLPDRWVDEVEELEKDFGNWTIAARQVAAKHHSPDSLHHTGNTNEVAPSPSGSMDSEDEETLVAPEDIVLSSIEGGGDDETTFYDSDSDSDSGMSTITNTTFGTSFDDSTLVHSPQSEFLDHKFFKNDVLTENELKETEPGISKATENDADTEPSVASNGSRKLNPMDEQFESNIGRIISRLPTRIKFKRQAMDREYQSPRNLADRGALLTPPPRTPTRSTTPTLTLANNRTPKQNKNSKARSDPTIRVYHLHQSGRTKPIKLFVRLVGENGERVMVRRGGGWEDLEDYLRDYATHHRRAITPDSTKTLHSIDGQQCNTTRSLSVSSHRTLSESVSPPSSTKSRPFNIQQNSPSVRTVSQLPQANLKNSKIREPSTRLGNERSNLSDNGSLQSSSETPSKTLPSRMSSGDGDIASTNGSTQDRTIVREGSQTDSSTSDYGRISNAMNSSKGSPTTYLQSMGKVGNTKRVYRKSDGALKFG